MATHSLQDVIDSFSGQGSYIDEKELVKVIRGAKETILKLRAQNKIYSEYTPPQINVFYDKPSLPSESSMPKVQTNANVPHDQVFLIGREAFVDEAAALIRQYGTITNLPRQPEHKKEEAVSINGQWFTFDFSTAAAMIYDKYLSEGKK